MRVFCNHIQQKIRDNFGLDVDVFVSRKTYMHTLPPNSLSHVKIFSARWWVLFLVSGREERSFLGLRINLSSSHIFHEMEIWSCFFFFEKRKKRSTKTKKSSVLEKICEKLLILSRKRSPKALFCQNFSVEERWHLSDSYKIEAVIWARDNVVSTKR